MSQHPWASQIGAVINMDACGVPGRLLLFQSGTNDWLVKAYSKVFRNPYGGSLFFALFRSKLLPMQTDFHIFNNVFGIESAIDLAFIANNYIYHTKYDLPRFINPGALQAAGEDLLALLWYIQDGGYDRFDQAVSRSTNSKPQSPSLSPRVSKKQHFIAYDCLGIKLIVYPVYFDTVFCVLICGAIWMYLISIYIISLNKCYLSFISSSTLPRLSLRHFNFTKCTFHRAASRLTNLDLSTLSEAALLNRQHRTNEYNNGKYRQTPICTCYKGFSLAIVYIISGWLISISFNLAISFILTSLHRQMSWYNTQWLIIGLYFMPSLLGCTLIHYSPNFFNRLHKIKNATTLIYDASLFLTSIFCIFLLNIIPEIVNHFLLWLFCAFIGVFVVRRLDISIVTPTSTYIRKSIIPPKRTILIVWIHFLVMLLPLCMTLYVGIEIGRHLIPLLAFFGNIISPDYLVAVFCAAVSLELLHFFNWYFYVKPASPQFNLTRSKQYLVVLTTLLVIIISTIMIAIFSILGFPFNSNPKHPVLNRQHIIHLDREFIEIFKFKNVRQLTSDTTTVSNFAKFMDERCKLKSNDSGLWIFSVDYNGFEYLTRTYLLEKFGYTKSQIDSFILNCESPRGNIIPLQCGMPYRLPTYKHFTKSLYLPVKSNPPPGNGTIAINRKFFKNYSETQLQFTVSNFHIVSIALSPYPYQKLIRWSFADIPKGKLQDSRNTYFINHVNGIPYENGSDFVFSITLQTITNISESLEKNSSNQPLLDIAFSFHHMTGGIQSSTPTLEKFVNDMPDWVEATAYVANYKHLTIY